MPDSAGHGFDPGFDGQIGRRPSAAGPAPSPQDEEARLVHLVPTQPREQGTLRERVDGAVGAMRDRLDRTLAALVVVEAQLAEREQRINDLHVLLEAAYRQRDDHHDRLITLETRNNTRNKHLITAHAAVGMVVVSLLGALVLLRRR